MWRSIGVVADPSVGEMRFVVDANVGKLTKWLRLLGYDAVFFGGKSDGEMIALGLSEDRVVLTRDTHIFEWGIVRNGRVRALFISADDPETQMRQVVNDLRLEIPGKSFTRCLECGHLLKPIPKNEIEHRVPPYVFQTQDQFQECPGCGRVFWRGTHWRSMVDKVKKLANNP